MGRNPARDRRRYVESTAQLLPAVKEASQARCHQTLEMDEERAVIADHLRSVALREYFLDCPITYCDLRKRSR